MLERKMILKVGTQSAVETTKDGEFDRSFENDAGEVFVELWDF